MAKIDRVHEASFAAPAGSSASRAGRCDRGETGASAVEYGLLIAAVAVFFLAALVLMDMFGAVFEAGACDTDRGYTCTSTP